MVRARVMGPDKLVTSSETDAKSVERERVEKARA